VHIPTDWVVITGPPASGKTTLLRLLAAQGEITSADSTRELISDVVTAGRDAEEFRFADDFQPRVLEAMLAAEDKLRPAARTFLEYALPCNIAFHRTEERELTEGLAEAATRFRYRAVFILDPLAWHNDTERVEDEDYQRAVHKNMWDVYRELGYSPIRLRALSPADRLAVVNALVDLD